MEWDARYEILRELGRGPRGPVHLAADRHGATDGETPREVVVKIIEDRSATAEWFETLQRVDELAEPGFARTLMVGSNATAFVARPYLAASPLDRWLVGRGPLANREVLELVLQIGSALTRAHRRGLFHLGLKPSNVLIVESDGTAPVLTDLGIGPHPNDAAFTAPELIDGGPPSARADVYGLAGLTLALLTGLSPAGGALDRRITVAERAAEAWNDAVTGQCQQAPVALRDLLLRSLSAHRIDRPATLSEFTHDLRRVLYESAHGPRLQARGRGVGEEVVLRDGSVEAVELLTAGAGPVVRFYLVHRDPEGRSLRSGVFFYDRGGREALTYASAAAAWRGAEVSLFDMAAVSRGDEVFFTGAPDTVVVLEPYFPIAVTHVLKAVGCPTRYLVDLRDGGGSSRAQVMGKILHLILEMMVVPDKDPDVQGPDASITDLGAGDFEGLFEHAARRFRLDALSAGLGDGDIRGMRDECRRHYLNLLGLSRRSRKSPFEGALAEVSRFSGEYGLEGRIDLAFDDGETFHILELKTGRPYPDHAEQVRCYALMWDPVGARLNRRVVGEIVYSKGGEVEPVRRGAHDHDRGVLNARNGVVGLLRQMGFGDTAFRAPQYMEYPSQCRSNACRFRRRRCERQAKILGLGTHDLPLDRAVGRGGPWAGCATRHVQLARAHYGWFATHITAEYWTANEAMGRVLRGDALGERVEDMSAVAGLTLQSVVSGRREVTFAGPGVHVLTVSTRVVAHLGDLRDSPILIGRVARVTADQLTLETASAEGAAELPAEGWILDKMPSRVGFSVAMRALFDFLRTRDQARLAVILQRRADWSTQEVDETNEAEDSYLNPGQRRAVQGALAGQPAFLIQGPPGTGKTTVIAEIIIRAVKRGDRVLLAAATNTAVDTVLARLLTLGFTRFLRFGWPTTSPILVDRLDHMKLDPHQFFARTLASGSESLDAVAARIAKVPVFASTTFRAVTSPVVEFLERQAGHRRETSADLPQIFDLAILDEAAQITEPMTLGAINRAARFVLVGDHQQLPPVVTAERALSIHVGSSVEGRGAATEDLRERAGVAGLDLSLFERLSGAIPSVRLERQYRMNREIAEFSSAAFYDGALTAPPEVAGRQLALSEAIFSKLPGAVARVIDPTRPLVVVDVVGREHGHRNMDEVDAVMSVLGGLLTDGLLTDGATGAPLDMSGRCQSIGIISPFRAQVRLLRDQVRERFGGEAAKIEIDTVERFQGGEKEVMLVSFVASGRASSFLADHRRLNVTLTRAKSKLVIFGGVATLSNTSPLLGELINMPSVLQVTDTQLQARVQPTGPGRAGHTDD